MQQLNLFTGDADDSRKSGGYCETTEPAIRDKHQLNLFHAEPGLKRHAALDARRLDDVAVEILSDIVAERFYNGRADSSVRNAIAHNYTSGSGICREEDKPWRSLRSFGRITISVYDLFDIDSKKAEDAFKMDAAVLSSDSAREMGYILDNRGIVYGRYGFFITHFTGKIKSLGKV